MYDEDDYLLISGIQHFAICRRQWALIHIEEQWEDNVHTISGELMHERAHNPNFTEKRGDVITVRDMPIFSRTIGIRGACDVVEFRKDAAIAQAYLFYGETKRREAVQLDDVLREKVRAMFAEMRGYYDRRYTPRVKASKTCVKCSLRHI